MGTSAARLVLPPRAFSTLVKKGQMVTAKTTAQRMAGRKGRMITMLPMMSSAMIDKLAICSICLAAFGHDSSSSFLLRKKALSRSLRNFCAHEHRVQHSLHHVEANRSFLQDLGTLLKHKMFLAREVRPEFRQDPLQSHHAGKGETDAFECLYTRL